jgi:DNA-directed RNA polymerase
VSDKSREITKSCLDRASFHFKLSSCFNKINFIRLQFANDNLNAILASANHPLENVESSWWLDSDEPWQTLAACMEIRDALSNSNPENFISHLPIHQV